MYSKKTREIKEVVLLILIIIDIVLVTYILFLPVNPWTMNAIINFDYVLCFILFLEFTINLRRADNKVSFIKENWIDILAFLPLGFFRAFRIFRIIRIIKVLALFRSYLKKFFSFMVETHLDEAFGILLFAIASGTILFYIIESGVNRSLHGPLDSLWYSITTTMVGEVVIPPETLYGKAITGILMLVGVTFVGFLTASIASWFVKNPEEEKEIHEKIEQIEKTVIELKDDLEELKELIKGKR